MPYLVVGYMHPRMVPMHSHFSIGVTTFGFGTTENRVRTTHYLQMLPIELPIEFEGNCKRSIDHLELSSNA